MAFDGKKFQFDQNFTNPLNYGLIKLYQIGEICCEPTFQVPEHKQWCYEISYIISGSGSFFTNGQKIDVTPEDIVIVPKNAMHSITAGSNEPIHYAYLGFDFDLTQLTPENENLVSFYTDLQKAKIPNMLDIYKIIGQCIDEFYLSTQNSKILIESYLNLILILTKRAFENILVVNRPNESVKSNQIVYQIIRYVDRNIYTVSDINAISANIGYSNYYISHIFKQTTNMTLQQYINNKRIEKSIELLLMDKFSVTVIADKLNYTSIQSFSRAFKRTTGMYPSQYLNLHQKNS